MQYGQVKRKHSSGREGTGDMGSESIHYGDQFNHFDSQQMGLGGTWPSIDAMSLPAAFIPAEESVFFAPSAGTC